MLCGFLPNSFSYISVKAFTIQAVASFFCWRAAFHLRITSSLLVVASITFAFCYFMAAKLIQLFLTAKHFRDSFRAGRGNALVSKTNRLEIRIKIYCRASFFEGAGWSKCFLGIMVNVCPFCPCVDIRAMGFPVGWGSEPLW